MSEIKLLPCPFCGGEAKIIEDNTIENRPQYQIRCKNISCTIRPKTNWHIDKSEAIKQWNTRKPMERIVERLEQSRDARYFLGSGKISANYLKGSDCAFYEAIDIVKEEGGIE